MIESANVPQVTKFLFSHEPNIWFLYPFFGIAYDFGFRV